MKGQDLQAILPPEIFADKTAQSMIGRLINWITQDIGRIRLVSGHILDALAYFQQKYHFSDEEMAQAIDMTIQGIFGDYQISEFVKAFWLQQVECLDDRWRDPKVNQTLGRYKQEMAEASQIYNRFFKLKRWSLRKTIKRIKTDAEVAFHNNPSIYTMAFVIGGCSAMLGQYNVAFTFYKTSISLAKNPEDYLKSLYNLCLIGLFMGDFESIEQIFQKEKEKIQHNWHQKPDQYEMRFQLLEKKVIKAGGPRFPFLNK